MKDDLFNIVLIKGYAMVGLMLGNVFIFPNLSLELGILGSIGQFMMILGTYVYLTKNNKKRNVPSLFYVATAILAFLLALFFSEPLHDWLHKNTIFGFKVRPSTAVIALLWGAISEYTYEFVDLIINQTKKLVPAFFKWASNRIDKDGKEN